MKEAKIINENKTCTLKATLKPEEEIKLLRHELKERGFKNDELRDKLAMKEGQVLALMDIMLDLREMNKNQANDLSWQRRRTDDYRGIHQEALMACWDVISDYENKEKDKPSKAVYEFAKKIRDILRKI